MNAQSAAPGVAALALGISLVAVLIVGLCTVCDS
jgi:hypothetical protein